MAARVMWMVRENRCLWRDFPSQLCDDTEIAYQNNPRDRDLVYVWPPHDNSGTEYCIDFVAMQQTNLRSQFVREIRRVTIHQALPEAVQGPSQRARTGDTVNTGPSSSADPTAESADIPIIVVDVDMDGYELPEE